MKFYGEKGLLLSKDWDDASHFVALVGNWFDVFNSKVFHDRKSSRNAFASLENQNSVLNDMIKTAVNMRVYGSNSLYQFQKGLVISSQSLLKLYEMVKANFGISYLLTSRINQDALEHFFACLRQMWTCHNNPSTLFVKYRVRAHLLGKGIELAGSGYNSEAKCSAKI